MLESPFDFISCTWPRSVKQSNGMWISDPEWDALRMPYSPQPMWEEISGEPFWTINWREHCSKGLNLPPSIPTGEMRCFHIVFELRVKETGRLIFWCDDGCVIKRNGEIVHTDCTSHVPTRNEIDVAAGDDLQIAQWQYVGGWMWGARVAKPDAAMNAPYEQLFFYLDAVRLRLRKPNGPPLKFYTHGKSPVRAVLQRFALERIE